MKLIEPIKELAIDLLRDYMAAISGDLDIPKQSIYEFIESSEKYKKKFILKEGEPFKLQLRNIDFSELENPIVLSNGNFSGVTFDNVNFSAGNVTVRDANFIGCPMIGGTKFTGQIPLAGAKFGPLELSRDLFEDTDPEQTEYDPTNSPNIMLPLTKKCLEDFLKLNPKKNLNEYLNDRFSYRYPAGKAIVADLSNVTIDERFNGQDISGSNLSNTIITGNVDSLQLRDCITHNTKFKDCHLTNPDLRGTSLANAGIALQHDFAAVSFEGEVVFTDAKLSINPDIGKANGRSIRLADELPLGANDDYLDHEHLGIRLEGQSTFDPCYNKDNKDPQKYKKFTLEDVEEYMKEVRNNDEQEDFITYIKKKQKITGNIAADFSGLDFSNRDFSEGKFKNCDFSFTQLNGCSFNDARFENCNFSQATSSYSLINQQYPLAYNAGQAFRKFASYFSPLKADKPIEMNRASFKNCDLTWADLSQAKGENVTFDNVTAINLNAPNLVLNDYRLDPKNKKPSIDYKTGCRIINSDFRGAYLTNLHAEGSKIDRSNLSHAQMNDGHLSGSSNTRSYYNATNLTRTNASKSEFKGNTSDSSTDFSSSNFESTDMSGTKISGNCAGIKAGSAKVDDADLSETTGPGIDINTKDAINSNKNSEIESDREAAIMNENRRKFYNRIGIGILVGLVVASIAFPPLLGATLPIAFAAVAMPTIVSVTHIGAMVVGVPVLMELTIRNFSSKLEHTPLKPIADVANGINNVANGAANVANQLMGREKSDPAPDKSYDGPSIIRPLANFFGAKILLDLQNRKHQDRKNEADQKKKTRGNKTKEIKGKEKEAEKFCNKDNTERTAKLALTSSSNSLWKKLKNSVRTGQITASPDSNSSLASPVLISPPQPTPSKSTAASPNVSSTMESTGTKTGQAKKGVRFEEK